MNADPPWNVGRGPVWASNGASRFYLGAMDVLVPLAKVPTRIRQQFRSWFDHPEGAYLCGNCWFDLTDDDE